MKLHLRGSNRGCCSTETGVKRFDQPNGAHAGLLTLASLLVFACASPSQETSIAPDGRWPQGEATQAGREPERRENPLVTSLLKVAAKALAEGDLRSAEQRFARVLERSPQHSAAYEGLVIIARLRGDTASEREWLASWLEAHPASSSASLAWARLKNEEGKIEQACDVLAAALNVHPNDPALLALQLELTGPAPSLEGLDDEEIVALSRKHPFDLSLTIRVARLQIASGDLEAARQRLRRSYWLADLAPTEGYEIAKLLASIDPVFAKQKIVPVHIYADQTITSQPGWQMRLRILLRKSSAALDPLARTHYVSYSMTGFSSKQATTKLVSLENAWLRSQRRWPSEGILLGLTERFPARHIAQTLGRAELLGRRAFVRLAPGATESRTLIHEVFHLYGGVHVTDAIDSLMNPSGETNAIDQLNARIVALTRDRTFGPGGEAVNVDPFVDSRQLVEVYIETLRVNLAFRQEALGQAQSTSAASRYAAHELARKATKLDDHLAQVSEHVSRMLVRDRLPAKAAEYCDLAARLYGVNSAKGKALRKRGDRLREVSKLRHSGVVDKPNAISK
ncbi:MAG: tetratricopeptide (TPR) repeat protein [Myxococcota bacterium]